MGMLYKRGKIWWLKYYRDGKPYQESTRTTKETEARRLLKKREGEIAEGKLPGVISNRIRFEELAQDFITDYKINKRKTLVQAEIRVAKLKQFFGGVRISNITTSKVKEYIQMRMDQAASNATINRDLSALKRMFSLAAQCTPPKVAQIPYIPMLKEDNVRKGFFEHNEYMKLLVTLPDYLQPVVTFAYRTGWRRGEIFDLTWDRVDLQACVVRLEAGEAKNKKPRTVFLDSELMLLFKEQMKNRHLGCSYVFHNNGERINASKFRNDWLKSCKEAGVRDKILHDFRRTAVRNMTRAGIQEKIAMSISGHKTRAVFDRYNIVSEEDLKEAAAKHEAYLRKLDGYNYGYNEQRYDA